MRGLGSWAGNTHPEAALRRRVIRLEQEPALDDDLGDLEQAFEQHLLALAAVDIALLVGVRHGMALTRSTPTDAGVRGRVKT
jgi:hypothetical protein